MLKQILLLTALGCAATMMAASAKIVAADALTMSVNFNDGTTSAELANGRNTPVEERGAVKFVEGLHGSKALVSGSSGATIIYECKDNLNFDAPGTLMLWFKSNAEWHKTPPPPVVFWGLGGQNGGYLGVRISSMPTNVCACRRQLELMLYYCTQRNDATYTLQPPALSKLCRGWHLMAMAWSGSQMFLSFDGMPFRPYQMEKPLSNAEYAHCSAFALGYPGSEFLLDDFRIYGKKLSDEELQEIWNVGNEE